MSKQPKTYQSTEDLEREDFGEYYITWGMCIPAHSMKEAREKAQATEDELNGYIRKHMSVDTCFGRGCSTIAVMTVER